LGKRIIGVLKFANIALRNRVDYTIVRLEAIEEGRVYSADAVETEMMKDFGV
jgi:hypothetical protein